MAYMNQDKKKVIKAELDKVLKPLGIKYSLRVRDYMSITCTIKSGSVDFIGNFKTKNGNKFALHSDKGYIQVNQFWFHDHFDDESKEIIGKVVEALKSADYYDRSDAQVDYFDTAYYMHLNIGDYDKPYQLTGATK
jgi:hypothetical protein